MPFVPAKSRIHLLMAKAAPKAVLVQRKRSKLFHVLILDTETCEIEHGSWFWGRLYSERCDVSHDGQFMVYLAMGAKGGTWNGICRPPWLQTLADAENFGTWGGGGHFAGPRLLRTHGWDAGKPLVIKEKPPFAIEVSPPRHHGAIDKVVDFGPLTDILARDGFERLGPDFGTDHMLPGRGRRQERRGDDGWGRRPTPRHPLLRITFIGFLEHGYTFACALEDHPGLLDGATWANWDVAGNLWVARPGLVERYRLADIARGKPSFSLDVDAFEPSNE